MAADLIFNAGVPPYRHDEYEGGSNSDDEGCKRKKEFSDLFKKQMNMRKVNRSRRKKIVLVFLGFFFRFFYRGVAGKATQRSFCCTSVCQLLAEGRYEVVRPSEVGLR